MIGIERLRQMAEDFKSVKTSEHCTFIVNTWRGRYIDDAIADIADQIEREQDKVAQMDWEAVREVAADMASRVFMSATIDGLLRDWSRKLTDASDGRCHAADVSMSAYDLLPEDEREAIAWVREHGGIEGVKEKWTGHVPRSSVKRMVELHEKKRDRLKAHALWLERKCHERRERIKELDKAIAELDRRLVPEGMEWPKVDGEPVVIGERLVGYGSGDDGYEVVGVRPTCGWVLVKSCDHIRRDGGPVILEWDASKCHRPATKVLDADGAEIRVVDKVWGTNGGAYRVTSAHDGKVFALHIGGSFGAEVESAGGEGLYRLRADQLTHERPVVDTWERLEEDATIDPRAYCSEHRLYIDPYDGDVAPATEKFARDLVRRAKALAERDA